jgi:hypothetical protein
VLISLVKGIVWEIFSVVQTKLDEQEQANALAEDEPKGSALERFTVRHRYQYEMSAYEQILISYEQPSDMSLVEQEEISINIRGIQINPLMMEERDSIYQKQPNPTPQNLNINFSGGTNYVIINNSMNGGESQPSNPGPIEQQPSTQSQ